MAINTNLLNKSIKTEPLSEQVIKDIAQKIEFFFSKFNIKVKVVNTSVTDYSWVFEIEKQPKDKISKITNLYKELSIFLGYEASIQRTPGKLSSLSVVANYKHPFWYLGDALNTMNYNDTDSELLIPIGMQPNGEKLTIDIKQAPHILISGTTGAGKTVFLDDILLGIMNRATPSQVQFLLIDIVGVDFTYYNGLPYIIKGRAITNRTVAVDLLSWVCNEMEERYESFAQLGVKDIEQYNNVSVKPMPRMIVMIDEFYALVTSENKDADIKDIHNLINKIAAKARAAGVHLIIATQYDLSSVISGTVKNNFPIQISFSTTNTSRFKGIMNRKKRKLNGNGDMEFSKLGLNVPIYAQAPFVSGKEVESVVNDMKQRVK